jgi:hypothetical protein
MFRVSKADTASLSLKSVLGVESKPPFAATIIATLIPLSAKPDLRKSWRYNLHPARQLKNLLLIPSLTRHNPNWLPQNRRQTILAPPIYQIPLTVPIPLLIHASIAGPH